MTGWGRAANRARVAVQPEGERTMTKHLADHRKPSSGTRVKQFLRLARSPRETWKVAREGSGSARVVQFLRIARGRTV